MLICAGYQKLSVSLRSGQIFFTLLLTLCEDDGDRGGLSSTIELKWRS